MLTPDNAWIIGIAKEPFTGDYLLVFYSEIYIILERFIRCYGDVKFMEYTDFNEIEEIGPGGYGTVYTAKAKYRVRDLINDQERVALKRFKNFDRTPNLFISEVSNCPTREMFCAQYAN